MSRDWGDWTQIKLEALEKYMGAFTVASQKAKRTLYLDLFGGRPDNRARRADLDDDEQVFAGSALRAAHTQPAFTKLIVTELSRRAAAEQQLRLSEVADDRAEVIQGDCNDVMPAALDRLAATDPGWRWAPTFALVDQYSAEVKWRTLEKLASFKHESRSKVELCLYFGPSFMIRGLHGPEGSINVNYAGRLDAMFGEDAPLWRQVIAAREDDELTGGQAEGELVNTMRWMLENRLGYKTTIPLQMKNTLGRNIFSMIFATDHDVGSKIMTSLFDGAEDAIAEMVRLSKRRRQLEKESAGGQEALFEVPDVVHTRGGSRSRSTLAPPTDPFLYRRLWNRDR